MMIRKLKQQKGETLIEAMMSLLIAVICMSILTISVTTASKLNMETNKLDENYYIGLQRAEQHLSDEAYKDSEANVKIEFEDKDITEQTVKVTVYGGEDNAFASYVKGQQDE